MSLQSQWRVSSKSRDPVSSAILRDLCHPPVHDAVESNTRNVTKKREIYLYQRKYFTVINGELLEIARGIPPQLSHVRALVPGVWADKSVQKTNPDNPDSNGIKDGMGSTRPCIEGQQRAIRMAYKKAMLDRRLNATRSPMGRGQADVRFVARSRGAALHSASVLQNNSRLAPQGCLARTERLLLFDV